MKKFLDKFVLFFILLSPVLDVLTSFQINNNLGSIYISHVVRGLLFLFSIIYLLKNKTNIKTIIFLFIYFVISGIDILIFKKNTMFTELVNILNIFYLPVLILFFKKYDNEKINDNLIYLVFVLYISFIVLPVLFNIGNKSYDQNKIGYIGLFNAGNEISSLLVGLLPIIVSNLKNIKSIVIRIVTVLLIITTAIMVATKILFIGIIIVFGYYLIKYIIKNFKKMHTALKISIFVLPILLITTLVIFNTKIPVIHNLKVALDFYKVDEVSDMFSVKNIDNIVFSKRLTYLKRSSIKYSKSNLETKAFGFGKAKLLKIRDIEIDVFDIFFSIGIIGFISYIILMIYALCKTKLKGPYLFSFILFITISLLSGHVLNRPMVSIFIALLFILNKNKKSDY